MPKVAILPIFELRPGCRPDFVARVKRQRDDTLREEPGCLRFDVLEPDIASDRVVLYEVYETQDDLDRHRETAHYASFREDTDPLVQSVDRSVFTVLD
ncbi:antibiotic biosynthesis monooxygenase [Acuticoccus sp. M5D2P5]|uniref:putative quinol monooxygenase n=1 Tax=Acuticoccus kalidii TaxID=2910977 RepID=UPI001F3F5C53|nr:antibiotic biosynthesis monooxygenase family protein [Acuticoccus kalidii]MCF3932421.1 antibiotic biosynthesis monooxygenase [Acuticoccus kalidii]